MEQSAEEGLKLALKAHKDFGLPGQFHENACCCPERLARGLGLLHREAN